MHLRGNSPTDIIVVATTKIQTAVIMGSVDHLNLEVMLDSGASISLLVQASVAKMTNTIEKPIKGTTEDSFRHAASCVNYVTTSVLIQNMETPLQHDFLWLVILTHLLS